MKRYSCLVHRSFQALFSKIRISMVLQVLTLSGCAGYRFKNPDNPFESYRIKSLTIPMFVNHSNIAKASVPFTREIVKLLSSYPHLKVYQGEDTNRRDAILIGIITSEKYLSRTFKTKTETFTTGKLKQSIGDRREFFVPTSTGYNIKLRLILIKDPKALEVKLTQTKLVSYLQTNPSKIIFNHQMLLSGSFTREAGDTLSPDSSGIVNFSKNKGNFESSLAATAKSAALQFRETVLDVF